MSRAGRGRVLSRWLLLACLLAATLAARAQEPRPAELMPLAERSLILDLARAGSRLVAVGERGHVLLSDDQGRNWRQVPAPVRVMLTAVSFVDPRHGWAVGHDAVVLRSDDGGETWRIVHRDPEAQLPMLDVWFRDREFGLAVGAFGTVLETRDGGESWERRWLLEEDDFHLNQISADPDGGLWIAAEAGNLYRSTDAGETWQRAESPYRGSLFGLLPLGGGDLVLYGLRGHLFRSDDGGAGWRSIETRVPALLHGAARLESGAVVVVGMDGVILLSDPSVGEFRLNPQADRLGLTAVLPVAGDALVLAGEGGLRRLPLARLEPPQ